MVNERLKWKPQTPLVVLLLRVYRLNKPQTIPYLTNYGGCKSWIELEPEISSESLVPAINEVEYAAPDPDSSN